MSKGIRRLVWPEGHGLVKESAVCRCGEFILNCEAMNEWPFKRQQDIQKEGNME